MSRNIFCPEPINTHLSAFAAKFYIFDGSVYAVFTKSAVSGTGGMRLYISRSRDGLNWFDTHPIGGQPDADPDAPDVVIFQNKLWMIYRNYDTGRLCISKSTDGLSWTRPELIPKDVIDSLGGVSLCVFEGALYMGYQRSRIASGGNFISLVYSRDGVNWLRSPCTRRIQGKASDEMVS